MIPVRKAKTAVRSALALLASAAMLSLTSCHTILDDTDCVQSYNIVHFVYDYNIKFADAFGHEVERVSLLVFDHETGLLVKRIDAPRSALGSDHSLVLDIEPGTYDLLTWAGDFDGSFDIAQGEAGRSTLADFDCRMRTTTEDGGRHVREELAPLYHNLQTVELPYASPSKPHTVTVPLVKDTNTFRIVLQHINGEPVDYRDFEVTITDANGWMGHDNALLGNETLTYHPVYEFSGTVEVNTNPVTPTALAAMQPAAPASRSGYSAMLVEFTTGRLLDGHKPMLTVRNKQADKVVFQINLNEAALLVKGFHREEMGNQEYLDRQDEYNMTFFLDDGSRWVSTVIIINDWRIIRHEGPLS